MEGVYKFLKHRQQTWDCCCCVGLVGMGCALLGRRGETSDGFKSRLVDVEPGRISDCPGEYVAKLERFERSSKVRAPGLCFTTRCEEEKSLRRGVSQAADGATWQVGLGWIAVL